MFEDLFKYFYKNCKWWYFEIFIFLEVDLLVIFMRNGLGGVCLINFFFDNVNLEIVVIFKMNWLIILEWLCDVIGVWW